MSLLQNQNGKKISKMSIKRDSLLIQKEKLNLSLFLILLRLVSF